MTRRTEKTDLDTFRAQLRIRRELSRAMSTPRPIAPIALGDQGGRRVDPSVR